ncbi:TIM barrel protein [Lacrimispora brassicae]
MKNILKNSKNPVTLQCTYSDSIEMPTFLELLHQLSDYGLYGIELNLPDLKVLSPKTLLSLLNTYQLNLTYIATGAYAKKRGFSLSSSDSDLRRRSIEGCKENIRYAGECHSGIIIGYFKNNPLYDKTHALLYLEDSLTQLELFARSHQVPILLEATNRYESGVANTLQDTVEITDHVGGQMLSVLPDTYHMNIEESNPLEALDLYQGRYQNIHLSDNNRYFPGMGHISFESYLQKIDSIHYQGTLGIEGNINHNLIKDLEITVSYLSKII